MTGGFSYSVAVGLVEGMFNNNNNNIGNPCTQLETIGIYRSLYKII
jgi:hypothetical protein